MNVSFGRHPIRQGSFVSVVLALVLLGAACGTIKSPTSHQKGQPPTSTATASGTSNTFSGNGFTSKTLANGNVVIGSRTWFAKPITLSPQLPIFPADDMPQGGFVFSEVGTTSNNGEIVLGTNEQGIGYQNLLILDYGSTYVILEQYSQSMFNQGQIEFSDGLGPNTTVDATTTYPEINPSSLDVHGLSFDNTTSAFNGEGQPGSSPGPLVEKLGTAQGSTTTFYANTPYGSLYKITDPSYSFNQTAVQAFQSVGYELVGFDFLPQEFLPAPAITSLATHSITFSSGSSNASAYANSGGGCSHVNYSALMLQSPGSYGITAVGDDAQGHAIYAPTSTSGTGETLLQTYYNAYAQYNKSGSLSSDSQQTFLANDPILLYKDVQGSYNVLFNTRYYLGGQCGKPVIYLYPTSTTNVHVSVDATITQSVPEYNAGWSVMAHPNGQLAENGGTFGSLYWEGTANRPFPAITRGTVVPHAEASSILAEQATTLGLNAQEEQAFLAYWMPKIPTTSYVEISWLTTADMNALVPLHVTPRPQTMLRIFVVMRGLDQNQHMTPEILHGTIRRGFTLVEWGGLLG